MKPGERIAALLGGKPVDRVPVWLWLLGPTFAAMNTGCSLVDIFADPDKSFWAQMWTQEMYDSDDIPRPCFGGDAVLPFGGEIRLPAGEYQQAPTVARYPVNSEDEAWKLKLPDDIAAVEPIPKYRHFARLQEEHGFPISIWCDSPFELVRGLCGIDLLCRWLIKNPDVVHHLLRLALDYGLRLMEYWVDSFPPERIMVLTVAPTASNQVISPRQFEAFCFPYEKERNEKIIAMGVRHIFCHICGEHNMNLPYWAQVPLGDPGIASFGHEVDIATAIEYLGDRCIIAGNVEPAVIQTGTPQQVYQLCREAIEKGRHAPRGFILMPGCGISHRAAPYNVYMLKKAVHDFGGSD